MEAEQPRRRKRPAAQSPPSPSPLEHKGIHGATTAPRSQAKEIHRATSAFVFFSKDTLPRSVLSCRPRASLRV